MSAEVIVGLFVAFMLLYVAMQYGLDWLRSRR